MSVAFQQAPDHPVDGLVVRAARADELETSLGPVLGVRRAPDLVQSDESTKKLIREFVRAVINGPTDGPEQQFALVVAEAQQHAEQLAELAGLAAAQKDAPGLFNLVRTPDKFAADVRGRHEQIEMLVKRALIDLRVTHPNPALVQQRTLELLSLLTDCLRRDRGPRLMPSSATEHSVGDE